MFTGHSKDAEISSREPLGPSKEDEGITENTNMAEPNHMGTSGETGDFWMAGLGAKLPDCVHGIFCCPSLC
jgi:hypothetical protein